MQLGIVDKLLAEFRFQQLHDKHNNVCVILNAALLPRLPVKALTHHDLKKHKQNEHVPQNRLISLTYSIKILDAIRAHAAHELALSALRTRPGSKRQKQKSPKK